MTFLFAWNTKQSIVPFVVEDIKIAHAKPVTTTTTTVKTKIPSNCEIKSPELTSDDCQVKNSVTPYVAVAATASFVFGKKIVSHKKLEQDGEKNVRDENEKKFDEIMKSSSSPPRMKNTSTSPELESSPKPDVEGTQNAKKPSFDEEAIQQTEEAEHASFTLAAAEKAVADVINETDDPTKLKTRRVVKERREAEKFAAVALKEYEETMEKVGITEEHPIDNVNTTLSEKTDDNLETREEKIANARKQPKSPDEERKLSERYAAMSLEERAFAILLDLGMIELSPDPDDPSYDSSQDDEFCPENRFD